MPIVMSDASPSDSPELSLRSSGETGMSKERGSCLIENWDEESKRRVEERLAKGFCSLKEEGSKAQG